MKLINLLIIILWASFSHAQIPAYYNDVNLTLTGATLKNELANKITTTQTTVLSYTPGVWTTLQQSDLDPTNGNRVLLVYGYNDNDGVLSTDRSRDKNANGGDATDWNREHVYPRSLGNPNLGSTGPGSDAHHLRPADPAQNSSRSNRRFAAGSGNSGITPQGHYYPGDEWKGDVARMMLYMYVRYGDRCSAANVGIGTPVTTDSGMINLFLQWNVDDPVSAFEITRNDVIVGIQGNRNPFIDNPAFATTIWGGPQAEDRFGGTTGGGDPVNTLCTSTVTSFPYSESFESNFGVWNQSNSSDDFNWSRRSGSTPSSNTGPSNASDGNNYIYMESSTPNFSTKRAILFGPCYDITSVNEATVTFKYHMYGASNMGSLDLEASLDGTNWTSVWSKSGNQGNSWKTATVAFTSYIGQTVQLRFNGVTGTTWQGDMAVDDFNFTTTTSSGGGSNNDPVAANLRITFDNYPEETSWEIRNDNNQVVNSGGTYGSQADGSTLTISASLVPGCYSLVFFDVYGDGMCCNYGNGSYELTESNGGTSLASGGSFTNQETTSFCVGTRQAEIVTGDLEKRYRLYPNPARDVVFFDLGDTTWGSMEIFNHSGRSVVSFNTLPNKISIQDWDAGIYIVKIYTAIHETTLRLVITK